MPVPVSYPADPKLLIIIFVERSLLVHQPVIAAEQVPTVSTAILQSSLGQHGIGNWVPQTVSTYLL